jgi:hypothetical protein
MIYIVCYAIVELIVVHNASKDMVLIVQINVNHAQLQIVNFVPSITQNVSHANIP